MDRINRRTFRVGQRFLRCGVLALLACALTVTFTSCQRKHGDRDVSYKRYAWMVIGADGTPLGLTALSESEAKGRRHYRFSHRKNRIVSVQYVSGRGYAYEQMFFVQQSAGEVRWIIRREGVETRQIHHKTGATLKEIKHLDEHGNLVELEKVTLNEKGHYQRGSVFDGKGKLLRRWKASFLPDGRPNTKEVSTPLGRLQRYDRWRWQKQGTWSEHLRRALDRPSAFKKVREFDKGGRVKLMRLYRAGTLRETTTYNHRGDPVEIWTAGVDRKRYGYDRRGRKVEKFRYYRLGAKRLRSDWTYIWDGNGRMVEEQQVTRAKNRGPLVQVKRTFDSKGFLTKIARYKYGEIYRTREITYVAPHRHSEAITDILSNGTLKRVRRTTYGADGTKVEERFVNGAKKGRTEVIKDAHDLITEIRVTTFAGAAQSTEIKRYRYDSQGRRIEKRSLRDDELNSVVKTTYDKGQIVRTEIDAYTKAKLSRRQIDDAAAKLRTVLTYKDGKISSKTSTPYKP